MSTEPKALTDTQVAAIMEQARVYASAWSLVGGVFDFGDALQTAEREKADLRKLLAEMPSESADLANRLSGGHEITERGVERQYENGIHIGSGLPRATCPCGFCTKHRHGFNQGDAALQLPTEAQRLQDYADEHMLTLEEAADALRGGD